MALIPAICTQCGAKIEVDNTKDAGICSHCGTAFVTEKVISNYATNYNNTYNVVENVTKIIYGNEKDEGEDFFKRGLAYLSLEEFSDAISCFNKAIELSPLNFEYRFYWLVAFSKNFTELIHIQSQESNLKKMISGMTDELKEKTFSRYGLDASSERAFELSLLRKVISAINEKGYIHTSYLKKFEILNEQEKREFAQLLYDAFISTNQITGADNAFFITRSIYYQDISYSIQTIKHIIINNLPEKESEFLLHANNLINKVEEGVLQIRDLTYTETNNVNGFCEITIKEGVTSVNVTAKAQTGCIFILPPSVKAFKISFTCTLKFTEGCSEEQIVNILKSGSSQGGVFINVILPSSVNSLIFDKPLTYTPFIISPIPFKCNYYRTRLVMDNYIFLPFKENESTPFLETLKKLMGKDFLEGKKILYNLWAKENFNAYEYVIKDQAKIQKNKKGFFERLFGKK